MYAKKHNLSLEAVGGTYSREYDTGLRREFKQIFRAYPRQVIETFTIIKLHAIWITLKSVFNLSLEPIPAPLILLAASMVVILIVTALFAPRGRSGIAGPTLLFGAFTIPPYIVGWSFPYTSADLICLVLIGFGLALVSVLSRLQPANSSPADAV